MGLISDVRLCCKSKSGLSKNNFRSHGFSVHITGWCVWDNCFLGPLDVDWKWTYANPLTPWHTLADEILQKYKHELGLPSKAALMLTVNLPLHRLRCEWYEGEEMSWCSSGERSSYLCSADNVSYHMCKVNGNFVMGLNSNSSESYFVNCEL